MKHNLLSHIEVVKEILTLGDIEVQRNKSYCHKSPIFLKDVGPEKVIVSNNVSSGEKNYKSFIGYLYDDHKVKDIVMSFHQIKWKNFTFL